ncbi:hypothetical protein [Methanoplanus endosymbiosus]|uniref:Uncharacterized protein n=1 Tax=Methanoplanus endosymbiosus TaxID=33865 RepID=A0A9E7PN65_9EURY|nr:hypothetical protein [Methanoplanus endosymbiosus]UUX92950.1 hypothetical protein L6E24_02150 [Methanoplanus endosymbiosus]
MKSKAGIAWECEGYIHRYLGDCGINCEAVTPQLMAAPFFRGNFIAVIIPTGFANPVYSGLLPALRASSERIRKFVQKGGNVMVFGAMTDKPKVYDWLPFELEYNYEYFSSGILVREDHQFSSVMDDFDITDLEMDGYFSGYGGNPLAETRDGKAVMIAEKYGDGHYLVTSIHEFPSREFLKKFCSGDAEILF